jgi:hypothetical protein
METESEQRLTPAFNRKLDSLLEIRRYQLRIFVGTATCSNPSHYDLYPIDTIYPRVIVQAGPVA